jgi:hypothetical protein
MINLITLTKGLQTFGMNIIVELVTHNLILMMHHQV